MKKLLISSIASFVILYSLSASAQHNERPLTNRDVVKLLRIKLPETAIIAAINSSSSHYTLTAKARRALRIAGATQSILDAMEEKEREGFHRLVDSRIERQCRSRSHNHSRTLLQT